MADLKSENGPNALPVEIPLAAGVRPAPSGDSQLAGDAESWSLRRLALAGGASGVQGRQGLVVLPPPSLVHGPLPVMTFLRGEPGSPESLTTGLQLVSALQKQAALGRIAAMAVVLPDIRGRVPNQQCLNVRQHLALATWLRTEVPGDIASQLDVEAPGRGGVVGGRLLRGGLGSPRTGHLRRGQVRPSQHVW